MSSSCMESSGAWHPLNMKRLILALLLMFNSVLYAQDRTTDLIFLDTALNFSGAPDLPGHNHGSGIWTPSKEFWQEGEVCDSSFRDGRKLVMKNDKYGYADTSGIVVIPFLYEDALEFSEGYAAVKQNGSWGYIDVSGKTMISFHFSSASNFVEGRAEVVYRNDRYHVDKKGKMKKVKRWLF